MSKVTTAISSSIVMSHLSYHPSDIHPAALSATVSQAGGANHSYATFSGGEVWHPAVMVSSIPQSAIDFESIWQRRRNNRNASDTTEKHTFGSRGDKNEHGTSQKLEDWEREPDYEELKSVMLAAMTLHLLGDVIGYKNRFWEFNEPSGGVPENLREEFDKTRYEPLVTRDRIYEFLTLGGINAIDIEDWIYSDDTLLNILTIRSLTDYLKQNQKEKLSIKKIFPEKLNDILQVNYVLELPNLIGLDIGITTKEVLEQYQAGDNWRNNHPVKVNERKGAGNGAAIRTLSLGLVYWRPEDERRLVVLAYYASKVTHNHPIGYMGGVCAALFMAYAIRNTKPHTWYFSMLDLLKNEDTSPIVEELKRSGGYAEYKRDIPQFWTAWKIWQAWFERSRMAIDFVTRIKWFRDNIGFRYEPIGFVGRGGHDGIIMAYDALLRTDWEGWGYEKLLVLSALHSGDSDSTGCMAGAWFGGLNGFSGIPKQLLKNQNIPDVTTAVNELFPIFMERDKIYYQEEYRKGKKVKK
jgi:ADP-ribosylarginine hydrolase